MALVVFTGGARSGKSRMATRVAAELSDRGQGVTAVVFGEPSDAEMTQRIARHRAERPAAFEVVEVTRGDATWLELLRREDVVVLDCLGTCLSQLMVAAWEATHEDAPAADQNAPLDAAYVLEVERRVSEVVDALCAVRTATIVVTNEVGQGVVPVWASARLFRDLLGRVNAQLVGSADAAYLCVAGRALDLSALPVNVCWPED